MNRELLRYLPLLIVCLLLLRRTRRPRTIRPSRLWVLWIAPAVLLLIAGMYIVGAIHTGSHLDLGGGLIVAAAAACGIALGALRAHTVRLARRAETGTIEATLTAWGLLLLLAWVIGRALLRQSGLVAGALVKVYGLPQADGTLKAYVLAYYTGDTMPAN